MYVYLKYVLLFIENRCPLFSFFSYSSVKYLMITMTPIWH